MKPLPHMEKKDDKQAPHFSRQQVSEDTERSMTGRPQKFGAAMPDDQPAEGDNSQPGAAPATPEDQGIEPEQPGNEEGMPDPSAAQSREDAEAQAADHIGRTQGAEKMVASHHGNLHDILKRLAELEAKNGGQGQEPATGPAMSSPDDDGY